MLRDNPDEAIGVGVGGDQTAQKTPTPTKPRKRNPNYAATQQLISLAVAARDEATAHPTAKNKALREAAYMRVWALHKYYFGF